MSAREPTAKERTVPMPGVDLREQDNYAKPIVTVDGPRVYAVASERAPHDLHLAVQRGGPALCKIATHPDREETIGLKIVCQACRAEASRLRATVAR